MKSSGPGWQKNITKMSNKYSNSVCIMDRFPKSGQKEIKENHRKVNEDVFLMVTSDASEPCSTACKGYRIWSSKPSSSLLEASEENLQLQTSRKEANALRLKAKGKCDYSLNKQSGQSLGYVTYPCEETKLVRLQQCIWLVRLCLIS